MKQQKKRVFIRSGIVTLAIALPLMLQTGYALAADDDVAALRKQLEGQRALIQQQSEMLKLQQQKIDQQTKDLDMLSKRLDQIEQGTVMSASKPAAVTMAAPAATAKAETPSPPPTVERDPVGDLNAEAVRAGIFPGSFRIPGPGNLSLAVGGFVKAVGIYDSHAENMGADFLPATLRSSDREGATSFDVTITRLFLDGRAPAPGGLVRGYVEYDLNSGNNGNTDFKLRHAYGTWKNAYGTLTAGHTWSTAMDLQILPEGITEPTVSGVIFSRQSLVRWSQPLGEQGFTLHAAVEDPSSSDIFSTTPVNSYTSLPDGVLGLEYNHNGLWHLRLNGLVRDLKTDLPAGGKDSATAWGTTLTGHLNVGEKDKLRVSTLWGEGVGRYFLGIDSRAGAIDPSGSKIKLRKNWGIMANFLYHWSDILRSTIMGGYANSEPLYWQPGDTIDNSTYGAVNLMWSLHRYLALGVEYAYGKRENNDGSDIDNHRIALGVQFY